MGNKSVVRASDADARKALDAYFFVGQGSEEERVMEAWCQNCRDQHRPGRGWFWNGSIKGYGPWDVRCHSCGKYIHQVIIHDDKVKKKSKNRKAGNPASRF